MISMKLPKKKQSSKQRSLKGRVEKSKIRNGKHKKLDKSRDDQDDPTEIKKRPSKVELKSVILSLQKDADLLLVRKALKYIPFYLKSEGLTKKLLKEITRLWAESSEKIRVICLLCLIRIYTKLNDDVKRQAIIKNLYSTFMDKCRITKSGTMSMIGFMRHSLIELYRIDPKVAYKQAQTSSQQMTTILKNAMTHKNEETYKSVLNWQFANCLTLLSQLIASQHENASIKGLAQQVIQLNLGSINLLKSPRYYPFYCHLLENLVNLSNALNVFVPILPLIMSIITRISIKDAKDAKDDEDEDKVEYNMDLLNHVSLDEVDSMSYKEAVLEKLYTLTVTYLANQSNKIAFPELVFIPTNQLKKWLRANIKAHKFKNLLNNIKTDCEKINDARKSITFAFTDKNAVDAWEKVMRDSNTLSLPKLNEQIKAKQ